MVEQIFERFQVAGYKNGNGRLKEPALVTHIFMSKQMREGTLPTTQYGRLVAHSYSP